MGIEVLPPDLNASDHGFVVSGKRIRFGLDAVKNVGHSAVEAILAARADDDEFSSLWEFCERVDARAVNRRATECLIKCGAFDSTGATRKVMLEALPHAQANGQKAQEDAQRGQSSIFDLGGGSGGDAPSTARQHPPLIGEEFDSRELLRLEKQTLGTFLSEHPLSEVRDALRARVDCSLADLAAAADGSWVTVGGLVTERKKVRTKRGDEMMFATLDDLEGQVELLVFNSAYAATASRIEIDRVVLVRGRVDHKERGETKLVVQEAEAFEPTAAERTGTRPDPAAVDDGPLVLQIDAADFPPTLFEELRSVLANFPGECEVLVKMRTRAGTRELRLGREYRVAASHGLRAELDSLLGPHALAA
jgi:DNA polymerase-3 subunit alpha